MPVGMGRSNSACSSTVFGLLVAVTACSLTKKQDDATASATAVVAMPPAPVFNVANPPAAVPGTTAPAAPQPVDVATGKVAARTAAGGGTHSTHATSTAAAAPGAGGSTAAATAATAAATGGAPAATPTLPTVRVPNAACVSTCAGQAQTCIVAAGIDAAKLTACQQNAAACTQACPSP